MIKDIKEISTGQQSPPSSLELLQQALNEKAAEFGRLFSSQDPIENKMAENMRPEMDRLSRLISETMKLMAAQRTTGTQGAADGKPAMGTQKVPRYVVRVSNAWRQAQSAAGKNPDDEIRKKIPAGANFTIQNI